MTPTIRQGNPQSAEPDAVVYQPYRHGIARVHEHHHAQPGPGRDGDLTLVREAVQAVDPDLPVFGVQTMDEFLAQGRWPYRVFGTMFTIFAFIALVLSAVGIYAVTAYSVTQRTAGNRRAHGARGAGSRKCRG